MDEPGVEHPRTRRRRRSWVFDVVVTLIAGFLSSGQIIGQDEVPLWIRVLLVVALTAPLLVRRLHPLPVFAGLLGLSLLAGVVEPNLGAPAAVAVAMYSFVATQTRRRALLAAGLTEVVIVLVALRAVDPGAVELIIPLTAVNAAVLGLGLYTGARRALVAELQDRATRLERERDQQGELAAAAERARIAREMHDVVAHHLTVMVALSDGAAATSATDPTRAATAMRTVSATGRQALADTRRLLGVLRDTGDGETGDPTRAPLPGAADLDALVDGVRAAGLPVTLEVRGVPGALPPAMQATVYRLVQEALTNTLKHAGHGASAHIRLVVSDDEVLLDAVDDGAGRAAPVPAGVGRGLSGMRERVNAFGGNVRSGPRAEGGWQVSARLQVRGEGP